MPERLLVDTPPPTSSQDPLLYRMVVAALGLALLLVVLGGLILTGFGLTVPDGIIALGTFVGGGLVGLLAPSPVR